jgi:hypothetical protein
MRIVIEIDGESVTAATAADQAPEPPPDLLRRAAERGALSAGPAPAGPEIERRLEASAPALAATDAGSAPKPPGEPEAPTREVAKPTRRPSARSRSARR